jgi:hypothetical protein
VIGAEDVAGFLASRRKKAELPSVPRLAEVEAFIANKPVPVVPVAVAKLVGDEHLRMLEGPTPSLLIKPLGSNIQHILDDIDMELEDSVGMADDNMGPSPVAAMRVPRKILPRYPKRGNRRELRPQKGLKV